MPDLNARTTGIVFVLTAVHLATSALAQSQREVPVTFELKEAGFVTLVVEEADTGRRVRNLIQDTRFEAGEHTIYWDGYNQGERFEHPPKSPGSRKKAIHYNIHRGLVDPGNYRVRGLVHDDVKLRYLTPVHSPGTPPWHTIDHSGAWLADHTPSGEALYLPDGSPHGDQPQVFINSLGGAETGHSAMWLTMDGEKLYGGEVSAAAFARDEGVRRIDRYYMYGLSDGKLIGFVKDVSPQQGGAAMYKVLGDIQLPEPGESMNYKVKERRLSIAVRNRAVLVGCPWENQVLVYELKENSLVSRGRIHLRPVQNSVLKL